MASSVIGSLRAILTLNSSKFEKGTNRARKATGRLKKGIGALKASIAGLVGAGGLTALAKKSVEFADNIAKTADKVGLTTDSLQELRFAAGLAGVEMRTFDMGIQRFARRVGEAAERGKGELLPMLEKYNIAVKNADGTTRSIEAVLRDYADAIANAGSQQEALLAAFKAFDSEGAALVNLLRRGSTGMDSLRQRARSLGLVIEEGLLRQSEQLNDQLSIVAQILRVKFTQAVIKLAPHILDLTNSFIEMIPHLEFVGTLMAKIGAIFKLATAAALGLGAAIRFGSGHLEHFKETMAVVDSLTAEAMATLRGVKEEMRGSADAARQGATANIELTKSFQALNTPAKKASETLRNDFRTAALDSKFALGELKNQMMDTFHTPSEQLQDFIDLLKVMQREGVATAEESMELLRRKLASLSRETKETSSELVEAINRLAGSLENRLADAFVQLGERALDFKGFMVAILREINRELVRMALIKPLLKAGTNALGDALSGFSFGGARAAGGPVTPGRAFMVGEMGPELFVPQTAGQIIPNNHIGQSSGGVVINMDLRGSNGDASIRKAVMEGLRAASPKIVDSAVFRVRDGFQRDPDFFAGV